MFLAFLSWHSQRIHFANVVCDTRNWLGRLQAGRRALKETASILIVEDDQHIAHRLRSGFDGSDEFSVLPLAGTVGQALDVLFDFKPRLVLVDLGLPDGTGIEVIEATQKTDWPCDCIVLSVFGDESRVMNAIHSGAKGYLLKTDKARDILADLRAVLDGGSPISAKVARYILARVPSEESADLEDTAPRLTPRERGILVLVARGYKRHEIAADIGIGVTTVSTHISSIYRKLDANSNIVAVTRAAKLGLI